MYELKWSVAPSTNASDAPSVGVSVDASMADFTQPPLINLLAVSLDICNFPPQGHYGRYINDC